MFFLGVKETPEEFDNAVMKKLKEFVVNKEKQDRTTQPDLDFQGKVRAPKNRFRRIYKYDDW